PRATGIVGRMLGEVGARSETAFRIVWADGSVYWNRDAPPAFTLTFRSRAAEARVLRYGHVGLLEGYFDGTVDIDGDFALAARAAFAANFDLRPNPLLRMRHLWHEHRFSNRSIAQAKANARFHYGHGQEFYRYWLDRVGMMYTCAYWKEGTKTVEEA